jgi:tetratricopeptide (TPR) repeat protein
VSFRAVAFGVILLVCGPLSRADDTANSEALTPYGTALLDYKTGKDDAALPAIDDAEKAKPGDQDVEILKSRILTELKRYDEAEKLLRGMLTPDGGPVDVQIALGDVLLRKRSFDRAAKHYELALQAKPDDPDIVLKLVYTRVGASDLPDAGKYASQLKPLDPNNPSYYFAKAAIAQATGKSAEADDDIQTVRTIYGITVANRYLRTYFQFLNMPENGSGDLTPAPLVKPAPAGTQ